MTFTANPFIASVDRNMKFLLTREYIYIVLSGTNVTIELSISGYTDLDII